MQEFYARFKLIYDGEIVKIGIVKFKVQNFNHAQRKTRVGLKSFPGLSDGILRAYNYTSIKIDAEAYKELAELPPTSRDEDIGIIDLTKKF